MHSTPKFRWSLLLSTLVGLAACTNNDVDPNAVAGTPSRGDADFTRYVAVGNSLTAGFADGGLYRSGQLNSYPNILAGQFRTVGGGDFIQPLFTEAQASGSGYTKLTRVPNPADPASLLAALGQVAPGANRGGNMESGAALLAEFTTPNQNLGVPGIRVSDVLTVGYGSRMGNQYFERLVTDKSKTYFQYTSDNLSGATFYSCWLGNNDALQYAISGGGAALTPTALFTTNFTAMMNKLAEGGRKGVVVAVPDITKSPFFTTATAQIAAQLKASGIPGLAISSKSAPGGVRISGTGDYFLLSIAPLIANFIAKGVGLSAANPIPDQYVLDAAEVQTLSTRISEFNAAMKAQADAKGAAYMDPNGILNQITAATGLVRNDITYTASFIQGGVYSLDGIHLTPAGYALIANEIIKSINAKYKATVPSVNPANYNRVLLQP